MSWRRSKADSFNMAPTPFPLPFPRPGSGLISTLEGKCVSQTFPGPTPVRYKYDVLPQKGSGWLPSLSNCLGNASSPSFFLYESTVSPERDAPALIYPLSQIVVSIWSSSSRYPIRTPLVIWCNRIVDYSCSHDRPDGRSRHQQR